VAVDTSLNSEDLLKRVGLLSPSRDTADVNSDPQDATRGSHVSTDEVSAMLNVDLRVLGRSHGSQYIVGHRHRRLGPGPAINPSIDIHTHAT